MLNVSFALRNFLRACLVQGVNTLMLSKHVSLGKFFDLRYRALARLLLALTHQRKQLYVRNKPLCSVGTLASGSCEGLTRAYRLRRSLARGSISFSQFTCEFGHGYPLNLSI